MYRLSLSFDCMGFALDSCFLGFLLLLLLYACRFHVLAERSKAIQIAAQN